MNQVHTSAQLNPHFEFDGFGIDSDLSKKLRNHVQTLSKNKDRINQDIKYAFPINAFPIEVQRIITATNQSLNFPVDFIGASLLFAASVAIGNTTRAQIIKGYEQSAVFYIAIVGKPGTNKTAPMNWATKPIARGDSSNYQKYQREKQEFDSVISLSKKEREEQGQNEPVKPIWIQHLVSDFTPEALASIHNFNIRGLGVSVDELGSWFKNFNRYQKGSEQELWLSNWSGISLKVNRKNSEPINIDLPFISVAGTIQPGVLHELAQNRTENGFVDRLLFFFPDNLKKNYWSEIELHNSISESWYTIISNLYDFHFY